MGFLGSIGDAIGGAVDYVGDKVGSAAEAVGGVVAGPVGDVVTDFIPGPIDDLAQQGISSLVNGGGGGGQTMGIARGGGPGGGMGNGGLYSQRGGGGFIQPDPVDFGPFTMNPGAAFGGNGGGQGQGQPAFTEPLPSFGGGGGMNGMMGGTGFQSALMASLVQKSIRSSAGRAVLEAVTSGSLQGGIIQQTIPVQTPRGEENHSPPGFRTVYVSGEPFAVFKPVAKSLGLLPKTTRAKITAADMKAITKADRLAKTIKRLGQKTGRLKITNK